VRCMLLLRLLTGSVLVLAVASGTAEAREAPLRLVQPPLVVYRPGARDLDAWVRLNRPLKHNIGHPGEYAGHHASLELAGTNDDFEFGLERRSLHPTCYGETLFLDREQPELVDGQPLAVTLRLDGAHSVTATATVEVREGATDPQAELGCPVSRRSQPCRGDAHGEYQISLVSAAGISCAKALDVMRSVARWASGRCYRDLCARRHHRNRGFGCSIALAGEAFWDVVCRRGKHQARGYTAE
jgi:hypothetical protein